MSMILALIALGACRAIAAPLSQVVDKIASPPLPWLLSDESPAANEPVKLRISLKQQNIDKLEETIVRVSTPEDAQYRQFVKRDALEELLSPSESTYEDVIAWLEGAGVSDYSRLGNGWLGFSTNVQTANALLDTTFQWFTKGNDEQRYLRTLQYAVPEPLASKIDLISPTTDFPITSDTIDHELRRSIQARSALTGRQSMPAIDTNCTKGLTPHCVRELYNVNRELGDVAGAGKTSIASFYGYDANRTDFESFKAWLLPEAIDGNFTNVNLLNNTPPVETIWNSEPSMDLQAQLTILYPLPIEQFRVLGPEAGGVGPGYVSYYGDPSGSQNFSSLPLNEFVEALLATPDEDLPHTLSISWGADEFSLQAPIAKKVCNGFGQLAARGMSVFVSSGDYGVGKSCLIRDPVTYPRFSPKFPSTCPWVTSVGGTTGRNPEQSAFLSGGGFSEVFPRPAYQEANVKSYFENTPPVVNSSYYNAAGRGYPDIAAQSINLYYVDQGSIGLMGGTSASAPIVAGVFGFMNAELLKRGRKPMGLINPWLYKNGIAALNDITTGDGNRGCLSYGGSNSVIITNASFSPVVGWDPVTGLGSPDFGKIFSLVIGN